MSDQILFSTAFATISQRSLNQDMVILEIEHPLFTASLSLYGGQVLSWQPRGHEEVFWQSNSTEFKQGKAIRGGIPLCWPWFGAYIDKNGNHGGNHGFARNNHWQLISQQISENDVILTLAFIGERVHELWPAKFKVIQTLTFSSTFNQQLTISNLSQESVNYSSALHSYFKVSHPNNVQVPNLHSVCFDDKITNQKQQKNQLADCVGPIDRIYYSAEQQVLIDSGLKRKITLDSTHCQQWVLWNPGHEIAKTMQDIHDEGENEFVCLEAANTQWQTIGAGEHAEFSQRISVDKF
ncbi:D-hexose-6-phosphate mutarotase [Thalassotalea castellviae]|uniref:Putative glucose-6-phosphate 1-epimerase n=1 Tax=Thalassotalea castellviae TaxID=3075612 RepID=A0ABU2ZYI3_9GAMM|nr:D-hexose-6-phosphate mutarotase [Thalassotalea sp. W431]MDT0602978.1 D-hexose-6-phosphate mutarotase [Thalassotalea sp. W431]